MEHASEREWEKINKRTLQFLPLALKNGK